MRLMSACCCLILSPFPRFEFRKKTLSYFVQIWNLTGVASLVRVSGFRSVLIFNLSISLGVSIRIGVVSMGARSRHLSLLVLPV